MSILNRFPTGGLSSEVTATNNQLLTGYTAITANSICYSYEGF